MTVYAVMVAYNPDVNRLNEAIRSIIAQVDKFIIVNNSETPLSLGFENIHIVELGKNKGIAFAQNRGIEIAEREKADFVLLSDQDTVYPSNYIKSFEKYLMTSEADVFCPAYYDNISNTYSPIMIEKLKSVSDATEPIFVSQAIASGSLIRTAIFNEVGKMDEKLFIDYVDFEWCWRVTASNRKILAIPSIVINHNLGDCKKKVLWKQVTLRSDFRYFYILRNGYFLAFHCKHLNLSEKIHLFYRTVRFSFGVLVIRHNLTIVKIICKSFWMGCFGIFKN